MHQKGGKIVFILITLYANAVSAELDMQAYGLHNTQLLREGADTESYVLDFDYVRDYKDILAVHYAYDDIALRFLRINNRSSINQVVNQWFITQDRRESLARSGWLYNSSVIRSADNKLIGAVTCRMRIDLRQCRIVYVFVAREFQGRGFGRKLLEATLNFCVSKGCSVVQLDVHPKNFVAQHVYEHLGFRKISSRADNIVMEWQKV
jgi:ribosomal protein S18 acetylase RimI-like enzyme